MNDINERGLATIRRIRSEEHAELTLIVKKHWKKLGNARSARHVQTLLEAAGGPRGAIFRYMPSEIYAVVIELGSVEL